jgi:hypothetical protein
MVADEINPVGWDSPIETQQITMIKKKNNLMIFYF